MNTQPPLQLEPLESVLIGLAVEHETLIELAGRHRQSLRAADAKQITKIATERAAVNARIMTLDRKRAQIVSTLAEKLGLQGAGITVRALVAQIGGQTAKRLSVLAENLRTLIQKARTEQAALRDATAAFAGHLGSVLSQVVQTCSVGQTYTARGHIAAGTTAPMSVDFKH